MNKYGINKNVRNLRTGVNFIRNVAAPKIQKTPQTQSSKFISNPSHHLYNTSTLIVVLVSKDNKNPRNLIFSYNMSTKVGELLAFLKNHSGEDLVYFTSGNLHVDYFLTLQNRYVRQLPANKLTLMIKQIQEHLYPSLKQFEIIKCIGSGGFSKVLLGRAYGKMMAIKIIDKDFIFKNAKQSIIQNQKTILELCSSHPFVTKLYMSFQTQHYIAFCLEYCNGGQLFNLLRKVKRMKESQAKFYFLETLSAIEFLHSKGILYRDLKPENIIIDSDGHIRLADYGLSKIIDNQLTYSFCGSAEYMAPQMLTKQGHSYEIDYYCLGALLYELVTGLPPFYSRDQNQLFQNILTSQLTFPSHTVLSQEIKSFLSKILEKEKEKRFQNIDQIYAHPWVSSNFKHSEVLSLQMKPPYQTQMFLYNFDDSEFSHEEKIVLKLIQEEKTCELANRKFSPTFQYVSDQIMNLKKLLTRKEKEKFNFYKPKMKVQPYYSRQNSLNISQNISKKSNSIQRGSDVKTIEKHYFPTAKSPQKKTNAPWIQNQYLKGGKSSGNIQYYYQRNAFSPKSNRYMNIYTSKQNLWMSNKYKNDSLTKYYDKDKKLSVSLSKKNHSRESSLQKSKSQEKNNFYFDRRGSDFSMSQSHSQGYLSTFKERLYPPKVKKSFKQDKVNFYFPKNNYH